MPQGRRGKVTIAGHEPPRNRHMAKTHKKNKKHDKYRAIIFFNYMTFVENIFSSYQGGPYSPTVPITPNSPSQGWCCES